MNRHERRRAKRETSKLAGLAEMATVNWEETHCGETPPLVPVVEDDIRNVFNNVGDVDSPENIQKVADYVWKWMSVVDQLGPMFAPPVMYIPLKDRRGVDCVLEFNVKAHVRRIGFALCKSPSGSVH